MALNQKQAASFFAAFADDPRREVNFPPAGGPVWVRPLGATGKLRLATARTPAAGVMEQVLAYCVISEEGEPFATAGQWAQIWSKHEAETDELFRVAAEISYLGQEQAEKN